MAPTPLTLTPQNHSIDQPNTNQKNTAKRNAESNATCVEHAHGPRMACDKLTLQLYCMHTTLSAHLYVRAHNCVCALRTSAQHPQTASMTIARLSQLRLPICSQSLRRSPIGPNSPRISRVRPSTKTALEKTAPLNPSTRQPCQRTASDSRPHS